MAQLDVFSFAGGVTALLIALGFAIAFLVNRRLTAFRWWAASFFFLALAMTTVTLRFDGPSYWFKVLSWASFYGAACLIAMGLYREGATRTNPVWSIVAGTVLSGGLLCALVVTNAPPHLWFLLGPIPTLLFMAWGLVPMLRARAWGYSLALGIGIAVIAMRALWYTTDLMRMGPARRPLLRGTLAPSGEPSAGLPFGRPPPPRPEGLIGFHPPQGVRAPVEQPLTITLVTIAAILGLALLLVLRDVLAAVRHMQERSTTDAMTGLLNRVTFDERAQDMLAGADRIPVCVVLFDIDHFKTINDTFGHLTGDRVIAHLGRVINETETSMAIAGRVGGEEFAVTLRGINLSAARLFAEDIRARFADLDLKIPRAPNITVSAGIAMRDGAESLSALMSRADRALYTAKDRGRNQVVVATDMAARELHRSTSSRAGQALA